MLLFLLFVLGTGVGSFLNVCIWRLPRHESVSHPPSHCPKCNTRLGPLDLFPLLSQFLLKGKCRYCGAKFSWRYFGVELLTGVLFLLVGLQPGYFTDYGLMGQWIGDPFLLARDLTLMSTLVVVSFVDYDTLLIQLDSVFLMGFAGLAYSTYSWYFQHNPSAVTYGGVIERFLPAAVPEAVLAMVVMGTLLAVVRSVFSYIYQQEAMGFGDVLLASAIGANLGWNITLFWFLVSSIFIGAILGTLIQIPRAIKSFRWAKRREKLLGIEKLKWKLARKAFRKGMPFGPMLAIGAVFALLYGRPLDRWYAAFAGLTPPPAMTAPAPVPFTPVPVRPYYFDTPAR